MSENRDPWAPLLKRRSTKKQASQQGGLGALNGPLGWLLVVGVAIAGILPNLKASGSEPPSTNQPRQLALPGFEPPPPPKPASKWWIWTLGCLFLISLCMMSCVIPILRIVVFGG